ncbi:MAG: fibronectin type III domain-containing protein, partial [Candidatus Marinimicrobia bacterium]|nr:fibronectin type III domain-containing protein [Candidatus Neomarinimicrobiota bacterium]
MKKFVIFRASVIAGIVFLLSCGDRDPIETFREFNLRVTSEKLMITLSWDRIADDDLTGYNLYRSAGGGELELYKVLETEDSSYVDSTVSSDVVYGYQVTAAFVGGRESDPSEVERI